MILIWFTQRCMLVLCPGSGLSLYHHSLWCNWHVRFSCLVNFSPTGFQNLIHSESASAFCSQFPRFTSSFWTQHRCSGLFVLSSSLRLCDPLSAAVQSSWQHGQAWLAHNTSSPPPESIFLFSGWGTTAGSESVWLKVCSLRAADKEVASGGRRKQHFLVRSCDRDRWDSKRLDWKGIEWCI